MVQQLKEKRRYVKSPNWKPRPTSDRKVMIWGTVKKEHFVIAKQQVDELFKQWR